MADALDYSQLFAGVELTTSNATIVPALTSGIIRNLVITASNKTASPETINVYVVPSGGTAGDDGTNYLVGYSIPANDYREFSIPKLIAGDFVVAAASADNAIELFEEDSIRRV